MANETLDVPTELLELLAQSKLASLDPRSRVRVALAVHLFLTQEVSIGRAAELAEYPLVQFHALLNTLGLPTVFYGAEEHAQDRETIEALEQEGRG